MLISLFFSNFNLRFILLDRNTEIQKGLFLNKHKINTIETINFAMSCQLIRENSNTSYMRTSLIDQIYTLLIKS